MTGVTAGVSRLEFYTDAGEFLAAAGDHLAADPVVSTLVASLAQRTARAEGIAQPDRNWWLVVWPDRVSGGLTVATEDDVDLVAQWYGAFMGDADEQAGQPVHLTAAHPPAFGVARIGPVYTPPAQRGRGWASNAVAEVSRLLQARGERVCLYTDQANPASNKIYANLGYRPVVDMANLAMVR